MNRTKTVGTNTIQTEIEGQPTVMESKTHPFSIANILGSSETERRASVLRPKSGLAPATSTKALTLAERIAG